MMSEFEFLSILVSIIIGLGMTHILRGSISLILTSRSFDTRLVYSTFMILILVLNWWVIFGWRDHPNWSFSDFLVLVTWAVSHYIAAITLFPLRDSAPASDIPIRWFLLAFAAVAILDIFQTAVRGDLFEPWYYMPFVLHYAILSLIGFRIDSNRFHQVVSWWFLVVTLFWALIVRRYLL